MILDLITIALYSSLGTFENLIIPLRKETKKTKRIKKELEEKEK